MDTTLFLLAFLGLAGTSLATFGRHGFLRPAYHKGMGRPIIQHPPPTVTKTIYTRPFISRPQYQKVTLPLYQVISGGVINSGVAGGNVVIGNSGMSAVNSGIGNTVIVGGGVGNGVVNTLSGGNIILGSATGGLVNGAAGGGVLVGGHGGAGVVYGTGNGRAVLGGGPDGPDGAIVGLAGGGRVMINGEYDNVNIGPNFGRGVVSGPGAAGRSGTIFVRGDTHDSS